MRTVLEPDGRAVLTEALRPPTGFELVHAVGTTFTLDLPSLIAVPLSFAGAHARSSNDPVAIMESLRRHSDRIDVFCQAGMIGAPRQPNDLLALVEQVVHPVLPPPGGLFHPKVWMLEYASGDEREYRFLCGSRNLTGDRSWDVMVRLDGRPRTEVVPGSVPVADFLRALPAMVGVELPGERRTRIDRLADRLTSVEWELPPDIRTIAFHPMGVGGAAPMDLYGARHALISPFLTDGGIAQITAKGSEVHVISRPESFDRLSAVTAERLRGSMWILDDAADDEDAPDMGLRGLHAKAVVLDRQSGSRIFAGSANATEAALQRNVEFMVELVGPQPRVGVATIIGDRAPFRSLLQPYETNGGAETPEDEQRDHLLEQALRDLAAAQLRLDVVGNGPFALDLVVEAAHAVPGASVRLVTVPALIHPLPRQGGTVRFDGLDLTELTPFVVLRIEDDRGRSRETVVLAELHGDRPERVDAVLAKQLDSPEKFLRFLLLLLDLPAGSGFGGGGGADEFGIWSGSAAGVFESLVRATAADTTALADLERIVDRIRSSGGEALPTGFDELWDVITASRSLEVAR